MIQYLHATLLLEAKHFAEALTSNSYAIQAWVEAVTMIFVSQEQLCLPP